MYRYEIIFNNEGVLYEKMSTVKLRKDDSYKTAIKRLKVDKENKNVKVGNLLVENYELNFGWFYSFAMITYKDNENKLDSNINFKILEKILKGFDCTIKELEKIANSKNSFNIIFKNGQNIILQNGKIFDIERISSGTYESITLATIISQMVKEERNYFSQRIIPIF